MQWYKKALGILFCLILTWNTLAQVVYEPTYHTVYPYLSRLAQKGVIELNDVSLQLSKDYIYKKLDELSKNITALTPLEREELAFYLKEYTLWWRKDPKSGFEGEYKSILRSKIGDRFRYAAFQDENFTMNLQPIIGYETESSNRYSTTNFYKGIWAYGYIGKSIGFSVDFRDHVLSGPLDSLDYKKDFSPEQGRVGIRWNNNTYKYNVLNAQVTAQWKWGHASMGKTPVVLGYGEGGKVIMSEKAPSYPNFRLELAPVKWLSLSYVHGWLNSDVVDSTTIRLTSVKGMNDYEFRPKYLAMHALTFRPIKGLYITAGESVIYSNSHFNPVFFVPLITYVGIDHYLGGNKNNTTSNSQLFFQLSSRNHLKKTHLYGSFFIDEIRLGGIAGDSANTRNQTAYQIGMSVADFPFRNISLTMEYSKIRPFAYENFFNVQTYTNSSYNLGHWLGTNASQVYMSALWRIRRGWHLRTTYQYVQKGDKGIGYMQQFERATPFLWGKVKRYGEWNIETSYEIIHDLFLRASYKSRQHQSDDFPNLNYQENIFSMALNIGI